MHTKQNEWNENDETTLLKLRNKNFSYLDIAQIMGKTPDSLRNKYWQLKNKNNNKWIEDERVAFLDIETSGFEANFHYMLSWSIKYQNGEIKHDCITRRDITKGDFDKRILKSLLAELENADTIVTYYGSRFDIPFLRTRALMLNLDFPHYGAKRQIDLYYSVKYGMKLARNTLEQATLALGIEGKNHVLGDEWLRARVGDRKALDYVLDHNDKDVLILEDLYNRLLPYNKFPKKSI